MVTVGRVDAPLRYLPGLHYSDVESRILFFNRKYNVNLGFDKRFYALFVSMQNVIILINNFW